MTRYMVFAVTALALAGCAGNDKVLFVTDSALGINFDSKPATLALGYDRNEGLVGPVYENGGIPQTFSSIETGGDIFNPKVRQLYATGQAANAAAGLATEPLPLLKGAKQRSPAVFGTTTNVGLKIGFGAQTIPDSFSFGYKRKELSWIPLGAAYNARARAEVDVYPSVLAVIDNTIATNPSVAGTGMTLRQFFASGEPAVVLAGQERANFRATAAVAVADVTSQGREDWVRTQISADSVDTAIAGPNGTVNSTRLTCLVGKANAAGAGIPPALASQTNLGLIRQALGGAPTISAALAAQIPNCP